MEVLSKLLGSENRVKILRLFLFNPSVSFDTDDVALRTKASRFSVKHELAMLRRVGLVKQRRFLKTREAALRGRRQRRRKKVSGYVLDESFPYLAPLQNLLIKTALVRDEDIAKRFASAGRLKLLVAAGVFIQDPDSRVDLLIVGDGLRRGAVDNAVKTLESEIGKEIRYSAFDTREFTYRLGMYDKLIRDIFDYNHRTLLDRLGVEPPVGVSVG
jgi:hypothetical protein